MLFSACHRRGGRILSLPHGLKVPLLREKTARRKTGEIHLFGVQMPVHHGRRGALYNPVAWKEKLAEGIAMKLSSDKRQHATK